MKRILNHKKINNLTLKSLPLLKINQVKLLINLLGKSGLKGGSSNTLKLIKTIKVVTAQIKINKTRKEKKQLLT